MIVVLPDRSPLEAEDRNLVSSLVSLGFHGDRRHNFCRSRRERRPSSRISEKERTSHRCPTWGCLRQDRSRLSARGAAGFFLEFLRGGANSFECAEPSSTDGLLWLVRNLAPFLERDGSTTPPCSAQCADAPRSSCESVPLSMKRRRRAHFGVPSLVPATEKQVARSRRERAGRRSRIVAVADPGQGRGCRALSISAKSVAWTVPEPMRSREQRPITRSR